MDYRKLYLQELFFNTLKYTFKPRTLGKAIKQPWKIFRASAQFYKNLMNIMRDVRLKPLSTEYLLNTVTSSVSALATLSSLQGSTLDTKNITDVFGEFGTSPADSEALGSLFKSYGSDKSTKHNYYLAYSSILAHKRDFPIHILEI